MNNKKPVVMFSFLVVAGLSITMLFQNCQQSKLIQAKSAATTASSSLGSQTLNATDDSAPNQISVVSTQSNGLSSDCSATDAFFQTTVSNVGADALFCIEYQLDMPVGSARFGESGHCDSPSKFRTSSWPYSVGSRSFTSPVIYTRNHAIYVPGSFVIVVKDNQGVEYRSNPIIIRRPGAVNCFASTSGSGTGSIVIGPTPPGTCRWEGSFFSPVPSNAYSYAPAYACTASINGSAVNTQVGSFSCRCY